MLGPRRGGDLVHADEPVAAPPDREQPEGRRGESRIPPRRRASASACRRPFWITLRRGGGGRPVPPSLPPPPPQRRTRPRAARGERRRAAPPRAAPVARAGDPRPPRIAPRRCWAKVSRMRTRDDSQLLPPACTILHAPCDRTRTRAPLSPIPGP